MIALADKISKSFAGQLLYTDATLQLNAGERWALVGPNGAGKTTLLRIIMGLESPDSGSVSLAKDINLGYLEQESIIDTTRPALEELLSAASEIKQAEAELEKLEHQIAEAEPSPQLDKTLERYSALRERFERLGGYSIEAQAKRILAGLGFSQKDFAKTSNEFSGGWQMRLALAKLLLRRPDLLLLDEPTNHLDLESVIWLEQFISNYDGAVLLVSHDRAFMDACASHIASLENKRLVCYSGSYSSYLSQREANLEQLKTKRAAQLRDIDHMQVFVDRFRYKPTKAKQVQERVKRIEKLKSELVVLPEQSRSMHFSFPKPPRTGDMVIKLEDIHKSFGEHSVYDGADLTLYRGDHVALVGPNGAGKSTLMKLMAGILEPDKGSISYGQSVSHTYYAQHQLESLNPANSVLKELDSVAAGWTSSSERSLLGAFLFHGDDVEKPVSVLSGGERARLALAKMLVAPDPLLLLDEPTNHLDIDSVDILEKALASFEGTIVLISHDEHLVRTLSNKVIDVRDGVLTPYLGTYDYYLEKRAALEANAAGEAASTTKEEARSSNIGTGRNVKTREQRRLEAEERNRKSRAQRETRNRLKDLEAALEPAQKRMAELLELMADEKLYADSSRFELALSEYNALTKKIAILESEWMELTEELEGGEDVEI